MPFRNWRIFIPHLLADELVFQVYYWQRSEGGNPMANQEHLDILKQGVIAWNQWRQEHPELRPDLVGVDLRSGSFIYEDYDSAAKPHHPIGVDLSKALLVGTGGYSLPPPSGTVHHVGANLSEVNFSGSDLSGSDLSGADLSHADLRETDLSGADLSGAWLNSANLIRAELNGADFSNAKFGFTVFGNVDLSNLKGLDTVKHYGPSTIGIDTIYRSKGKISESFLRQAGVPDSFLEVIFSITNRPAEYYTVFISYSSKNQSFAERLYTDLQNHGVRCWFAPHDLKWGERIRGGIDQAILLHEKLLLILSKHSLASGWVEHEVKMALGRERKEKQTVLFPVRVDKAILESPLAWATEIRHERNIGDFTRWKDDAAYQQALSRLLRDLKAEK